MTRSTCLPPEILAAIFEKVDDLRDLRHVRMASRTLCATATPFAFRALSVITTSASAQNLGRLFDIPNIAAYIREVSYHDTGPDERGWFEWMYGVSSSPSSYRGFHDVSRAPAVVGDIS
jgi:hypothetical protein